MMFELPAGTAAKLVHVNIRGEFHGAEVAPQADIRFEVALPNAILDAFDPALRLCLYMPAPPAHPAAKLPELPGVVPVSDSPAIRFPDMAMPLRWNAEGKGYAVTIDAGNVAPLTLTDVTVGGIRLDCLDGGTVGVDFRVQTSGSLDVDTLAALAAMVQRTVRLAVTSPVADVPIEFEEFGEPATL